MDVLLGYLDISGHLVDWLSFLASPWLFLVVLVGGALAVALVAILPFLGPYAPAIAALMMLYGAAAGWEHTALSARQAVQDTIARVNEENRKAKEEIAAQRDRADAALDREKQQRQKVDKDLAAAHARIAAQAKQPGQDGPMAPVLLDTVRSHAQ